MRPVEAAFFIADGDHYHKATLVGDDNEASDSEYQFATKGAKNSGTQSMNTVREACSAPGRAYHMRGGGNR